MRAGNTAWRIGERTGGPLRCIVKRVLDGGTIEVRSSSFSPDVLRLPAGDVFPDREACRAEIQRRAKLPKEQTALELPPGVTRGMKGE